MEGHYDFDLDFGHLKFSLKVLEKLRYAKILFHDFRYLGQSSVDSECYKHPFKFYRHKRQCK